MPTNYLLVNGMKIAQIKDGVRTDYLTDALGSVTATKNQSQQIVNTYRYKPYGKLLAKTGLGDDPRYLWTGNTGSRVTQTRNVNQYNVARHYANVSASWTSVDPLWPKEWAYGYVYGSPINALDSTGHSPCGPHDCTKDPCGYAQKFERDKSRGGGVVCCEGKKYACPFNLPPGIPPGFVRCIVEHERTHFDDVICPKTGFAMGRWKDPSQRNKEECNGYITEMQCVIKNQKIDCKGANATLCNEWYKLRIIRICKTMKDVYKCPKLPTICSTIRY